MAATNFFEQTRGQPAALLQQRQWPQLGRELYSLERTLAARLAAFGHTLTELQQMERAENIRKRVFGQLDNDDEYYTPEERYLAFLLVKQVKAGELVGNPFAIDAYGQKRELPYTGLEGYYAGSVRTPSYPGLMPEEVVLEEAHIGVELLRALKKHAIDRYMWASFAKMKRGLESGKPDIEDLKTVEILWAKVVRRLHVHIYDNHEFEMTLSEQLEQLEKLIATTSERTQEEKMFKRALKIEHERLLSARSALNEEEKVHEKNERNARVRIRRERLQAYQHFRDSTYALLKEVGNSDYGFQVSNAQWTDATITETIRLPQVTKRNDYSSIRINLTPEQLEGYLFLAELGDIGGNPLARSILSAE